VPVVRKRFSVPLNRTDDQTLSLATSKAGFMMKSHHEDVIPLAVMGALSAAILLVFAATV
jgi:hypothetical protein